MIIDREAVIRAFIVENDRRQEAINSLSREINTEINKLNLGEISGSEVADDFHNTKELLKSKLEELKKINRCDI